MKILIADDDTDVLDTFKRFLTNYKFKVDEVESGFASIRKIKTAVEKKKPYDVAILDLFMPMNGLEVAKQSRQFSPKTKIVICTAFPGHKLIQEAINNDEIDTMISKPVKLKELLELILKLTGKKLT